MLKETRSLDRGLQVLETLARHPALTLSDVCRETGLPKSTVRRLLATLISRRFARRSLNDGLYRATVTLPDISIKPVPPGLTLVADIGLTHALELTKKIGWPSDIHILEPHWMRIVESTRAVSPFALYQGQVDRRLNIFGAATGTACLSQMEEKTVRAMFDDDSVELRFRPARFGLTWDNLIAHLKTVRRTGYGTRVPGYHGETVVNDNLHAIGLPIRKNGEILGAMSLLWPRVLMPATGFAAKYLTDLRDTVAAIESDFDSIGA